MTETIGKTTPSRTRIEDRPVTELEVLVDISAKLDRLIGVLAAAGKERDQQIEIMSAAGCDSRLIGSVVGLTPSAVRTAQMRKRRRAAASGNGTETLADMNAPNPADVSTRDVTEEHPDASR